MNRPKSFLRNYYSQNVGEQKMSFQVPGWDLGEYKLLLQLLGVALIGIMILYIILSSRGESD